MTTTWHKHEGHLAARALVKHFPTPQAMRTAIRKYGIDGVFHYSLYDLPWNEAATIGEVLTSEHFSLRDVTTLHALLAQYARDYETWTAPDGTITRRDI